MGTINYPLNLARAYFQLPKRAMMLKLLAIEKLNHLSYLLGYAPPVEISAKEWLEHFPESENPYRDLKQAADILRVATVKFEGSDFSVKFVENIVYEKNSGLVAIYFNPAFLTSCV